MDPFCLFLARAKRAASKKDRRESETKKGTRARLMLRPKRPEGCARQAWQRLANPRQGQETKRGPPREKGDQNMGTLRTLEPTNRHRFARLARCYPTCCPLVRFSHIASKMLRARRDGPCAHGNAPAPRLKRHVMTNSKKRGRASAVARQQRAYCVNAW